MGCAPPAYQLPEHLTSFMSVLEASDGPFLVSEIFLRKFGHTPPVDGHHLIALFRNADGAYVPAAYVHMRAFGDICLVGGGATDGRAFANLSPPQRQTVTEEGGLFLQLLRFGFSRFAHRFSAFFGYCGDPRAEAVDLQAGFRHTAIPKLLIYTPSPLLDQVERALVAKAAALGPF